MQKFPLKVVQNMITLATGGFGVVVALAWNEAIKQAVATFVDPYLGKNSGVFSLFIYATIMTVLAVLITMQLSNVEKKLTAIADKKAATAKKEAKKSAQKTPQRKK